MPEQKPIKFTELFHFSEPTNAKIKLNRNNTTFPAWDLLLHDDPEWEIMNAYRGGERNNNHKMNGREYLFAFAQYYPYGKDYYIFGGLYRATEIQPPVYEGIGYKLEHMDQYAGYEKRLIIRINKVLSNNDRTCACTSMCRISSTQSCMRSRPAPSSARSTATIT